VTHTSLSTYYIEMKRDNVITSLSHTYARTHARTHAHKFLSLILYFFVCLAICRGLVDHHLERCHQGTQSVLAFESTASSSSRLDSYEIARIPATNRDSWVMDNRSTSFSR